MASGAFWNHRVLLRPPGSKTSGHVPRVVVAEHGRPERLHLVGVGYVEGQLERGDLARRGVDAELGGDRADPPGQVEVAAGDAVHVVAVQVDVHLRVGEHDVGVVVGLLGGLGDPGDQLEALDEAAGLEPGVELHEEEAPVVEALLRHHLGVAERLLGVGHGSTFCPMGPGLVAISQR